MLVLARKIGERIVIRGDVIVEVVEIRGNNPGVFAGALAFVCKWAWQCIVGLGD